MIIALLATYLIITVPGKPPEIITFPSWDFCRSSLDEKMKDRSIPDGTSFQCTNTLPKNNG